MDICMAYLMFTQRAKWNWMGKHMDRWKDRFA